MKVEKMRKIIVSLKENAEMPHWYEWRWRGMEIFLWL